MSTSKILFQLSGSIACFKACSVLSSLVKAGHEVEVVASVSALKFVGEATLEGLTGRRVHTSAFESGSYMSHIHLMRWADIVVLCPASANTLNKFAAGIGDDLLGTLFLAHDFTKPFLIVPAMNQSMYAHPATQASLARLSSWGLSVLSTGVGALACGEQGEGRMLEPNEILHAIDAALSAVRVSTGGARQTTDKDVSAANARAQAFRTDAMTQPTTSSRARILITSGGTEEPIDGVRSITNTSTGRTGAELALWFTEHGYDVTLLHSRNAVLPAASQNLTLKAFSSFASLEQQLKETLRTQDFDTIVHLAAVADYSLAQVEANGAIQKAPIKGKIDSAEELTLTLKRNPKLVDQLRTYSRNKNVKIVAFKLTRTADESERAEAVAKLREHASPDFIVHNDLTEMVDGSHPFTIHSTGSAATRTNGPHHLAQELARLLEPGVHV